MTRVSYAHDGTVATIGMDDGKANALSPTMLAAIGEAFDRAESDRAAAVVLAGRPGRFSGGFDLAILRAGGQDAERMLRGGFELAERMLDFPAPVVVACTGHAVAMGLFVVCAGDYRIGAVGDFKLQANEVQIGLTMPLPALAILRYRLTPSAFDRAVVLAQTFGPGEAVAAGLLDEVVEPATVLDSARMAAERFTKLDPTAHAGSKRRARATALTEIRAGIEADFPERRD